jgi:multidrug efflux system outer membrane protein
MRAGPVALLALAAATGCAVGPSTRVRQPTPAAVQPVDSLTGPVARAFLDSLAAARSTDRRDSTPTLWVTRQLNLDSLGDRPWLAVLNDSVLVSMVEAAMVGNQDLKLAVARVKEYRALLGAARGDLFPQINASGVASTNQSVFGSFPPQSFDVVRVTADLAWELDFWGKLRRQTQAAGFDLAAQEEAERAAVVTLVSDVVTAYLELRELDQEVAISEETLETRRASLALARRRFTEGVISELDVRQFESEAAGPAARVADFARQRAEKEHQLAVLLGRAPGPLERGRPLAETVQAVVVPDSIPGELLLRRPDVRRAERDLQAATSRIGLALGNRLPRVAITGQYGRQRSDFHDLFGQPAEVYFVQLGVTVPLFTGGKLLNQQRAASARADQARARYETAVLNALKEADDALVGLRLMKDQLVAQNTQVLALGRAFELARRRYENGVSSYLEVLDSQRGLFQAQLTLVQTERQYLGATVQLYKALGGGWGTAPKPR